MNRQLNFKIYNVESDYEEKPKINNMIKNQKKTDNIRNNQNIKGNRNHEKKNTNQRTKKD